MDYRKHFAVNPGAKVRLSDVDASFTGKHESHERATNEIQSPSRGWPSCNTSSTRAMINPYL